MNITTHKYTLLNLPGEIIGVIYDYSIGDTSHNNNLLLTCKGVFELLSPIRYCAIKRSFRGNGEHYRLCDYVFCITTSIQTVNMIYSCTLNNLYVPFSITANIQTATGIVHNVSHLRRTVTVCLNYQKIVFVYEHKVFTQTGDKYDTRPLIFMREYLPSVHSALMSSASLE